ncbi:MAG: host attachment protein [Rhodanobacter sp.]|nr:MAG: host attachment protein [Rhodanobacter sp.]TAL92787.1 MAG: host attachment protein [Rhodanobacter sp.]TAM42028.1 MAG: host attachment protein [Rhodanobacter sp.]TAN25993.1 MAG: host attachment protein [Rhodanobacter sp.]
MRKIPTGTWVMVADGAEARLFHNVGSSTRVSLRQVKLLQPEDLPDDGPAGHRPPESDDQATDEATFAKQLARRLNAAALKNEYEYLVLMADPQTLGQIRPQLHKQTARRIVMEVAKTFTNSPVEDIQDALLEE